MARPFITQKDQYQWDEPTLAEQSYPPHLKDIPTDVQTSTLEIFDLRRLVDTGVTLLPDGDVSKVICYLLYGDPFANTMRGLQDKMTKLTKQGKNIGTVQSIANRSDWYTDAVFAQQSFTGPNPTSITQASLEWIKRFRDEANRQGNKAACAHLIMAEPRSIFIQDHSYFRSAMKLDPNAELKAENGNRYGTAAVTLHQLSEDGKLHPLAIVIDWRINMENSVVIFNKRLSAEDSTKTEETDWPWRYAKMCNQVSDWTKHELAVHLNDCHFVEEATIVAAQRSFPADHVVFNLLAPHWLKTLSLNASARSLLVPQFINRINGYSHASSFNFINDAYCRFNWTAHYVPNDLKRRGFPESSLSEPRFHNYVWAKNMSLMWTVLQKFVAAVLATVYTSDADVLADKHIASWCHEMQSQTGGQMTSFPDITTVEGLVGAVTLCIHIASPQHNSVNYLQCYYMSFVPNKPASLSSPLPTSLLELLAYKEKDLIRALPVKDEKVWLMSSQLPYLLSYSVSEDQTLVQYAKNLEDECREKKGEKWGCVEKAAKGLYEDLLELGVRFNENSEGMDDRIVPYNVMDPTELAVSVLI